MSQPDEKPISLKVKEEKIVSVNLPQIDCNMMDARTRKVNFDCFSIVRFSDKETVETLGRVISNVGFWKAIRKFPSLQNIPFSGLGGRELKPF